MNATLRSLGALLLPIVCLMSACETGTSRQMTIKVDSPKLGVKDIALPATVKMTELGHFNAVVDVSWLSSNFERIARTSLPREGGSGGDRYHFTNFSLAANPDGSLNGFVHVTLDNYKYTKWPWPAKGQLETKAGHIESDVTATITPVFEEGHPTTVTSTKIIKTKVSGFVKLWNNALPKIWFSLDRKFQTANNAADRNKDAAAVLKVQPNPELDPFVDDILKRGLVAAKSIKFNQTEKGLTLVLDYQVVGGLPAYWEIYRSYKANADKQRPSTATIVATRGKSTVAPNTKP